MADIMDIDSILEDDLLDALGGISEVSTPDMEVEVPQAIEEDIVESIPETIQYEDISVDEPTDISNSISPENSSSISLDSSNIDSIASLLKELLNNKTIEITIKIK